MDKDDLLIRAQSAVDMHNGADDGGRVGQPPHFLKRYEVDGAAGDFLNLWEFRRIRFLHLPERRVWMIRERVTRGPWREYRTQSGVLRKIDRYMQKKEAGGCS